MLHPNIRQVFEADMDFMKVSIYPEYKKKIFAATRRHLCPPMERRAENKSGSVKTKPDKKKVSKKAAKGLKTKGRVAVVVPVVVVNVPIT